MYIEENEFYLQGFPTKTLADSLYYYKRNISRTFRLCLLVITLINLKYFDTQNVWYFHHHNNTIIFLIDENTRHFRYRNILNFKMLLLTDVA